MSLFIGRDEEILRLMDLLLNEENSVVEIVGIPGIGKARLLRELSERMSGHEHLVRAEGIPNLPRLDISGGAYGTGPAAEAASSRHTFERSLDFMLQFVAANAGREFEPFRLECIQARRRVTDTSLTSWQAAVDNSFVKCWSDWVKDRRVLMAVEGFDSVVHTPLGDWCVGMALRLRNTLVVLARRPVSRPPTAAAKIERIDLPSFTPEEVEAYVAQRFDGEAEDGLHKIVYDFTSGHPGGVELVGDIIGAGVALMGRAQLRRTLRRVPDDPKGRWARLVRLILELDEDETLTEVVQACSIVRSFEPALLAELLADSIERAEHAIERLMGYRMLKEEERLPGQNEPDFCLHEFLRVSLEDSLRTRSVDRAKELDQRAADYYYRRLQDIEDAPSETYDSWYRYERSDYQLFKRRWLRHAAAVVRRDRPTKVQQASFDRTEARFVLVWLEAFWWWGCYEEFEFNRDLLDEWTRIIRPSADDPVTASLAFILDAYPKGHVKRGAQWDKLFAQFLHLQANALLKKPPADLPESEQADLTRLSALLDTFLGHTRRYCEPSEPVRARRYFDSALSKFERLGDLWNMAWLLFEHADLRIDEGDGAGSVDFAIRAAEVLRQAADRDEEWDEELVANLARVRGDACWLRGERIDAFMWYAVAVRHAYRFQGAHEGPDAYTRRFYREVTTRATDRLVEAYAVGPREALMGCAAVLQREGAVPDRIDDLLAGENASALADALFPAQPQEEELWEYKKTSPFMDRWRIFFADATDTASVVEALIAADTGPPPELPSEVDSQ